LGANFRLWRAAPATCSTCWTRSQSQRHLRWSDTTTPHGRLVLMVLGGLAEFERTLIACRTGDGRDRAKARGVRFGRPRKISGRRQRRASMSASRSLTSRAPTTSTPASIGRLKA
jgi:DNA invertase Pin-like site-specific DNA recombinase